MWSECILLFTVIPLKVFHQDGQTAALWDYCVAFLLTVVPFQSVTMTSRCDRRIGNRFAETSLLREAKKKQINLACRYLHLLAPPREYLMRGRCIYQISFICFESRQIICSSEALSCSEFHSLPKVGWTDSTAAEALVFSTSLFFQFELEFQCVCCLSPLCFINSA